jgi:iron-sulfur cluster repair protein YtfE (RIC family)
MKDTEIFEGKKLSDLLRDIHDATLRKRDKIDELITDLRRMIQVPQDAVNFAPLIRGYLEVMIHNDEHLVKIATIVQRIIAVEVNNSSESGFESLMSEAERDKLVADALKELEEATAKLEEAHLPAQSSVSGSVGP